jgi:WD40 repeat protein
VRLNALAFGPDGRLATGGHNGSVRVWNVANPSAPPLLLSGHERIVNSLRFAPDGRLVSASGDGTARVWDASRSSDLCVVLRCGGGGVHVLAFGPDGRLVTGSGDGTVRLWDLREPSAQPLVLHGPRNGISTLGFSPDGRLVMGGDDGTVRIWDLDLDHAIDLARLVSGRNLTAAEWEQFFGQSPYHRTFPALPEGSGVNEALTAHEAEGSATLDANSPAARIH